MANEVNVGDVVKIKENGVAANFIVVHKGLPSTMYDSSCDGVWLLREKACIKKSVDPSNGNDFENSDLKEWLNGEYFNGISSEIRNTIKQVKIPYKKGHGADSTEVQTGADGLPCKIFLLAAYEVGFTIDNAYNVLIDGSKLSYFLSEPSSDAIAKRICYNDAGNTVNWWLRTPHANSSSSVFVVYGGARGYDSANSQSYWVRPAFVLPSLYLTDSDGNISTIKDGNKNITLSQLSYGLSAEKIYVDNKMPKLAYGSEEATSENCPPGAWYGQYE